MAVEERKYLDRTGVERLIANTKTKYEAADAANLAAAKKYADDLGVNYDAVGTAATKVQELANGQVKTNTEHIGTMDNLETTAKGNLVTAINEVRNAVSAGGTAAAITMNEQTTGLGDGIAKAYVLKQGDNTVGTINIPKDMVVQSGEVVTNPEGHAAGTYIKLVLANATNDEIFVNVGNLVDIYTAKASAAQVQLAIDSSSREISASIVAGSVTATELAADAVTTVKIADGNVTKAKLSSDVQASLDKADAAAGDATTKANKALEDAKAYADSKVEGVDLTGIATNAADIDKIEASLAEGGATANAIADAKKAGTDAQDMIGDMESLTETMNGMLSDMGVEIECDGTVASAIDANNQFMTGVFGAMTDSVGDLSKIATMLNELNTLFNGLGIDVDDTSLVNAIVTNKDVIKQIGASLSSATGDIDAAAATLESDGVLPEDGSSRNAADMISAVYYANANDIDALEASLAEGGATANAIADAKKAGTDAQDMIGDMDELRTAFIQKGIDASEYSISDCAYSTLQIIDEYSRGYGETDIAHQNSINDHETRLDALESVSYVALTTAEIDAMFNA